LYNIFSSSRYEISRLLCKPVGDKHTKTTEKWQPPPIMTQKVTHLLAKTFEALAQKKKPTRELVIKL
jgi:hypothetical protein